MVITSLGCIKRLGWVTIKTIKTWQPVSRCELCFCHVRRYPDNDRRFIRSAVWCAALIGIHPNNLHGAARNMIHPPPSHPCTPSYSCSASQILPRYLRSVDIELNALPYWAVVWLRWSARMSPGCDCHCSVLCVMVRWPLLHTCTHSGWRVARVGLRTQNIFWYQR